MQTTKYSNWQPVGFLLRGEDNKNNEDNGDRGEARGPQEFNISRCLRGRYLGIPKTHAASELSSSSNLYFIRRRTNRCLASDCQARRIKRPRVRRLRSRERKTAIIINNSAAQRHVGTMGVFIGRKMTTINNAVIIKIYIREIGGGREGGQGPSRANS